MRDYMLRSQMLLLVAVAFLSAGCGPKNAEEFRKSMRSGTPFTTVESFEVDRPFSDITALLRKKTKDCLDVTVRLVCTNCIGNRESFNVFKPTFVSTPKRTEVHLQIKMGKTIEIGAPPDGSYAIVLDASPVGGNKTKIDIYRQSPDEKFIHKAMRAWVKGENLGCPDLTTR